MNLVAIKYTVCAKNDGILLLAVSSPLVIESNGSYCSLASTKSVRLLFLAVNADISTTITFSAVDFTNRLWQDPLSAIKENNKMGWDGIYGERFALDVYRSNKIIMAGTSPA